MNFDFFILVKFNGFFQIITSPGFRGTYITCPGVLKSQGFINEPYYFIGVDEMHVYKQSNDTLFDYTTFSVKPNPKHDNYKNYYKIWANVKLNDNYYALKTERLATIPLTTSTYSEERFNIFIYKKNTKEILFVQNISRLKKHEMLNYNMDTANYYNNSGQIYYSLAYMNELLKLKRVKSKEDADIIFNELNHPAYTEIAEDYIKTNRMPDMYAAGLMAMLINKACLKLGYSPIGASVVSDILNTKRYDEATKKKMIAKYYNEINPE